MSEPSLSRTKPFASWRLKYFSTLRARVSTQSVGLSPCCVLMDFVGKTKGCSPREHGCSFKGQMRYRAEAHRAPQRTKELLRSQTTFPRLCSALKPSKKKHFVTKNRNYTTASELQASPQGHTNDFRLTTAGADTSCHSGCCCYWLLVAKGTAEAVAVWWLQVNLLLSHTNRHQHSSFNSLKSCSLLHKNQSSGRT